jgi:hypothetical protein
MTIYAASRMSQLRKSSRAASQLSQKQQHLALVLRVASGARFFRAIA